MVFLIGKRGSHASYGSRALRDDGEAGWRTRRHPSGASQADECCLDDQQFNRLVEKVCCGLLLPAMDGQS